MLAPVHTHTHSLSLFLTHTHAHTYVYLVLCKQQILQGYVHVRYAHLVQLWWCIEQSRYPS
jgi:hypothetical protein